MKLRGVSIHNFRSIRDLSFDFKEFDGRSLQLLFGTNESGKSNLLKAIRLLDKNLDKKNAFSYMRDCEKKAAKRSEEVTITFTFDDDSQINKAIDKLGLPKESTLHIKSIKKIIKYNDKSERKEYYTFDAFDTESPGQFVPMTTDPAQNPTASLSTHEQQLRELVVTTLPPIIDQQVPAVLYWEPSPEYLIKQPISLVDFKSDPRKCVPLRNMFHLLDIEGEQLTKILDRCQQASDEREEVEKLLGDAATQHLNELWPEHKIDISVRIESNMYCTVSVVDKDYKTSKFNMEERSDGFKQLISILLTLSVENKKGTLANTIILIDEPERSLHPSSTEYLRNELLNISKNNLVVTASHSIFMVDKRNLSRHIVVKKKDNETKIRRIDPENPYQEEVIYEALGTSIYELIEPYMIIFEGSMDKRLFDAVTVKLKEDIAPQNIRTITASGVTEIRKHVKFYDQKMVTGIIMVDSDQQGRAEKKFIQEHHAEFVDTTFELLDVVSSEKRQVTLEDILPEEIVLRAAFAAYGRQFSSPGRELILEHLKRQKLAHDIRVDDDFKELKKSIEHMVLEDIRQYDVDELEEKYPKYVEFVKAFHNKIKGIQMPSSTDAQEAR